MQACAEVVALAESLAGRSNRNAASDLEVSALLSLAASQAAAANVYVNLPSTGDERLAADLSSRTAGLVEEIGGWPAERARSLPGVRRASRSEAHA